MTTTTSTLSSCRTSPGRYASTSLTPGSFEPESEHWLDKSSLQVGSTVLMERFMLYHAGCQTHSVLPFRHLAVQAPTAFCTPKMTGTRTPHAMYLSTTVAS